MQKELEKLSLQNQVLLLLILLKLLAYAFLPETILSFNKGHFNKDINYFEEKINEFKKKVISKKIVKEKKDISEPKQNCQLFQKTLIHKNKIFFVYSIFLLCPLYEFYSNSILYLL